MPTAPTAPPPTDPSGAVRAWAPPLLVHALVWTLAAGLSRGNLDVPGDMVENLLWGQEWQAGYAKHPPLFAWVTAAWFWLWPRSDAAYFALAALNAALGLAGVATLARRLGAAPLPAALALAVSPLYTALAIKFNANAVLLSTWPWTAVCFVAWMQHGRARAALACGACAGLAMLGKYFSVVLLLALLGLMLVLPAWRARWRGVGPWAAALGFALVMAPHLAWLLQHDFATFGYAAQRSAGTLGAALRRFLNYTAAQALYLLPSALLLAAAQPHGERRRALAVIGRSLLRPRDHPVPWGLALAPLAVVGVLALLLRTPMASVWGMAQWFALTALWVVALGQAGLAPRPERVMRALRVYWAVVLVGAALAGWLGARRGSELASAPRAELAQAAQAWWRARTGTPLRVVAGSPAEAGSIVFYASDPVRGWSLEAPATTPWLDRHQVRALGVLIVCAGDIGACDSQAEAASGAAAHTVQVHKQAWGRALPARSFRLYAVLPAAPERP